MAVYLVHEKDSIQYMLIEKSFVVIDV